MKLSLKTAEPLKPAPEMPASASNRSNAPEALKAEILEKLTYAVGKDPIVANQHDWLRAASLVVRDRIVDRWMPSTRETYRAGAKRVYYLSLEFLIGRLLRDSLSNLEILEPMRDALKLLDVDLDIVSEMENDAALGNGGLGRLAACFMESMATVGIPAYGYGIRYRHGLFRQKIVDGWQVELPENWLASGNPWEFERREAAYEIGFGGGVTVADGWDGAVKQVWKPNEKVMAIAFDTPVVGYQAERVNTLRLWSARAIDPIRLDAFNSGDHVGALADKNRAESISQVLYPSDQTPAGQELRLRQEYFFSSASIQDIVRRHMQQFRDPKLLPEKVVIQMNDTHPAVAVAELMRLLTDVHGMTFDDAFEVTSNTLAYTNHMLLPEALESWPVHLFERLLPRHMQIIYAINARVIEKARKDLKASDGMLAAVSLIEEGSGRRVRMGHLAFVGSKSVNGVSALHSDLMKASVFAPLDQLYPGRINNKTNGITPRRWLIQSNPGLASLIQETIGVSVAGNAERLSEVVPYANDSGFQEKFAAIKLKNKERLAALITERMGLKIDPRAMFDVHVKRIHEYKRQLLNILETIALYDAIRAEPGKDWVPRVKIFSGKAAASYHQAKLQIKLINDVASVINNDPSTRGLLKVVFLPNFNVSLAEIIVPAADLSEQISTAGMEASGTGNMKFALNGALTIGTLDGANVEIMEHVGAENIAIFGLTVQEVTKRRREGRNPSETIDKLPHLHEVLSAVAGGVFSPDDANRYSSIVDGLRSHDWFMLTDDFDSYEKAQRHVDAIWRNPPDWRKKTILNTAKVGWFSSDRTIRDYAADIWGVPAKRSGN